MTVKYTKDHEWVRLDGGVATIGITNYAQEQLGDVVFVEVPEAGARFDAGAEAAVVESVKAAKSTPPSPARSSRATRPWPTTRHWSIPIRKAPAGSSR